ncbi:hypothetical protein [Acinetobacter baumannii]|uniref:hypothetical protein n=1 Tax=Acinetobacter baumannii TaxID=470 RepID=UPI0037C0BEA4
MAIETTYFGLTNIDLSFWSMIGTWLASIGTLAAVITSLYLARKNEKVNLLVTSNLIFLFSANHGYNDDDHYINIEITNNGNRPVTIQSVSWRIDKKKAFVVPINPNLINTPLPKMLNYGEVARWAIEVNAVKNIWAPDLINQGIKRKAMNKWKIIIALTTGERILVKPNKRIIELIQNCLPN